MDFRSLAPQSILLKNDLSGYKSSENDFDGDFDKDKMFAVSLNINFRDSQKPEVKSNPQLRIGFLYLKNSSQERSFNLTVRTPYDTLTSSQTGQQIFVDSVVRSEYDMTYSTEQLRLDGSLIFRTRPEARWSLYAGIGIAAGISFNATTEIDYSKSMTTEIKDSDEISYSGYSAYRYDDLSESFRNKTGFGMSVYIPLGVDFRMGKKREFWKRLHLFYEIRPGIDFVSIPELRNVIHANSIASFGLRVMVN